MGGSKSRAGHLPRAGGGSQSDEGVADADEALTGTNPVPNTATDGVGGVEAVGAEASHGCNGSLPHGAESAHPDAALASCGQGMTPASSGASFSGLGVCMGGGRSRAAAGSARRVGVCCG